MRGYGVVVVREEFPHLFVGRRKVDIPLLIALVDERGPRWMLVLVEASQIEIEDGDVGPDDTEDCH